MKNDVIYHQQQRDIRQPSDGDQDSSKLNCKININNLIPV